jgi:hypothetical protein
MQKLFAKKVGNLWPKRHLPLGWKSLHAKWKMLPADAWQPMLIVIVSHSKVFKAMIG